MIHLNHIFYKDNDKDQFSFEDISMMFEQSKMYAILYENYEEGKLFFSILAQLTTPTKGTIIAPATSLEKIGILMETDFILDFITFSDQLFLEKKEHLGSQLNSYCKQLELDPTLLKEIAKKLNPEQKRILSIIRCLLNYNIILAFEPTNTLSDKQEEIIFKLLKNYAKDNHCVIYLTRNKKNCAVADAVYGLKEGNLLFIR